MYLIAVFAEPISCRTGFFDAAPCTHKHSLPYTLQVAVRAVTAAGLLCHGVFQDVCGASHGGTAAVHAQALLTELLQAMFKLSSSKAEDIQFAGD